MTQNKAAYKQLQKADVKESDFSFAWRLLSGTTSAEGRHPRRRVVVFSFSILPLPQHCHCPEAPQGALAGCQPRQGPSRFSPPQPRDTQAQMVPSNFTCPRLCISKAQGRYEVHAVEIIRGGKVMGNISGKFTFCKIFFLKGISCCFFQCGKKKKTSVFFFLVTLDNNTHKKVKARNGVLPKQMADKVEGNFKK